MHYVTYVGQGGAAEPLLSRCWPGGGGTGGGEGQRRRPGLVSWAWPATQTAATGGSLREMSLRREGGALAPALRFPPSLPPPAPPGRQGQNRYFPLFLLFVF
jgi:hypothetical protein